MRKLIRHTVALSLPAMMALGGTLCSQPAAAASLAPLPAGDYSARSVCAAPEPGHAGCLAVELEAITPAARAHNHPLGITTDSAVVSQGSAANGDFGLRPSDLHRAYKLPTEATTPQTIALIDAYDDPHAEADLRVYDETFGLPSCTTANGCFEKVNEHGEAGKLPAAEEGWAMEISLDVQVAHATCQSCRILLVEASSSSYENLSTAELTAGKLGATEISNSWGGPEAGEPASAENNTAFNQSGIVITASAGDDGYLNWDGGESRYANFPASSPHVVAVGGTRLELGVNGGRVSETVWNGLGAGGGGCSSVFTAPQWQQSLSDWSSVGCGTHRSIADVSADADPYTGAAVYDASNQCESEPGVHWCSIGGTSLASPLIAAVYALAGGAHGVAYPAKTLYEGELKAPGALHDITSGSNGECTAGYTSRGLSGCPSSQEAAASCKGTLSCLTGTGYDGPTGVGTPNGIVAFEPGGVDPAGSEPPENEEGGPATGTSPAPASSLPAPPAQQAPPAASTSSQPIPVLSELELTHGALIAATHALARVFTVEFSFRMSIHDSVRGSLALQRTVHGHAVWITLPKAKALEIAAHSGNNYARMPAHGKLTPGIYRLTLTPARGVSRSIVFRVV